MELPSLPQAYQAQVINEDEVRQPIRDTINHSVGKRVESRLISMAFAMGNIAEARFFAYLSNFNDITDVTLPSELNDCKLLRSMRNAEQAPLKGHASVCARYLCELEFSDTTPYRFAL